MGGALDVTCTSTSRSSNCPPASRERIFSRVPPPRGPDSGSRDSPGGSTASRGTTSAGASGLRSGFFTPGSSRSSRASSALRAASERTPSASSDFTIDTATDMRSRTMDSTSLPT